MIVLHAASSEGTLFLWAESEETSALAGIGKELGIARISKRALRKVTIWLPSTKQGPVASMPAADAGLPPDSALHLEACTVDAFELAPGECVRLLAACAGKRVLRAGLLVGEDLSYWAAALRFAARLVLRGQFLPGLAQEGDRFRARWQPVISGVEVARVHSLAAAMPGACRALDTERGKAPPQNPAESVLRQFLSVTVDALVRESNLRPPQIAESLHDHWMNALTSSDGAVAGKKPDLMACAGQIQQWQRPIQMSVEAPFRVSFRLEEPEEDAGGWMVRYLLQSSRDPSLIVPAAEAWDLKRHSAAALGKNPAFIRERLLASLGEAAGIYPPIEASLRERAPEGCVLDASRAHEFLRDTAAVLEQSGFGVMLPAWWTRKGSRTRLTARAHVKGPKMQSGGGLSMETLVSFNWQLALGDETLSASELTALAKLKSSLVKVRGQWIEVDAAEIKAALDFLKKNSSETATVGDIVRMSLGAESSSMPVEISGVTASGWIGDLLGQLDGTVPFEEFPAPEGLQATLRPYQQRGYSWLRFVKRWGLGSCLADDMGLGKTVQALALIQSTRAEKGKGPVLIVCPTSVVGNWQKESARFAPDLSVLVHHGAGRNKGEAFQEEAARHAVVLSSYSLLHRDIEVLTRIPWSGVILDEAQNIKNPATKQARAARSLPGGWRIALTGTPVENHVGDLWSVMEFLNPGFLGTESAFKKKFFVPIQVYSDQDAASRLRRITGPFILRRLKTDRTIISDLPEKNEMKVYCTLTKEQASLYAAVVDDAEEALKSAEGIERRGLVLATLSKLKQVCNHPAQFLKDRSAVAGRSGKLTRLTEMMEETLEAGDRSLIFTQFTEMADLICAHLRESFGAEVLYLHGGTNRLQRDRMVERFSSEEGPPIFVLSLKAGGTGLNLTRANHVFHFDRWWNPAVENQATDRAFRIGQKKNVQVHKFVCVGTLEEKIDDMIERKKEVAGRVVGTGEGWLTELSNAELKNLFELRKEAIGE